MANSSERLQQNPAIGKLKQLVDKCAWAGPDNLKPIAGDLARIWQQIKSTGRYHNYEYVQLTFRHAVDTSGNLERISNLRNQNIPYLSTLEIESDLNE